MFNDPSSRIPSAPADKSPKAGETSPALERFRSCRWYRAGDESLPECCSHRDVLPLAGASGFDAAAWCPDCALYKVRRTPRKRTYDNDYRY